MSYGAGLSKLDYGRFLAACLPIPFTGNEIGWD